MSSRKNAMLTSEDRRWLTGEKTYDGQHAKQQRYQRRRDIRERVYNTILDFTVLFEHLEEAEREKIFGEVTDGGSQWENTDEAFRAGVRDGLAFLLRGIGVRWLLDHDSGAGSPPVAERFLALALHRAGHREGFLVDDIELDIQATAVAVPDLLETIESGAELTPAAVYLLAENGILDLETIQSWIREQVSTAERERR